MTVTLLTEHHLEFLSLKEAAQAHLSLHLSKCHIVGNHMSRLILEFYFAQRITVLRLTELECTSQQQFSHVETLPPNLQGFDKWHSKSLLLVTTSCLTV